MISSITDTGIFQIDMDPSNSRYNQAITTDGIDQLTKNNTELLP